MRTITPSGQALDELRLFCNGRHVAVVQVSQRRVRPGLAPRRGRPGQNPRFDLFKVINNPKRIAP